MTMTMDMFILFICPMLIQATAIYLSDKPVLTFITLLMMWMCGLYSGARAFMDIKNQK